MDSKIEQPIMIPLSRGKYYLKEDYTYTWKDGMLTHSITVPTGTITDGASIPRLLWTLTGFYPDGIIRPAALIHDWIYMNVGILPHGSYYVDPPADYNRKFSRSDADKLFKQILKELQLSPKNYNMLYYGVKLFGRAAWNDHKKAKKLP